MFGELERQFFEERVEFYEIYVVHFMVYGVLGRGVSGSSRLVAFAKEMGDWLRDVVVAVSVKFRGRFARVI